MTGVQTCALPISIEAPCGADRAAKLTKGLSVAEPLAGVAGSTIVAVFDAVRGPSADALMNDIIKPYLNI